MTDPDPAPDLDDLAQECLERIARDGDTALDAVCREHPRHAARIRGMVRQLRAIGFLDAPPADRADFGGYRIRGQLGAGGMAVVYLAAHERFGERIALKVIRGGALGGARARERFAREAEIVRRLDHPGICSVYEAGEVDGAPFLAMRCIDGETLAERIASWRRGTPVRARIEEALRLLEGVARAVHAAHEAGVVHRDLKPDNVMIDGDGQPVVLDFGLARFADSGQATLTASGDLLGPPAYMAPEQIGGGHGVDARADVYALGAVLYEAVTLRRPFEAPTRDALYRAILAEPPLDPRRIERAVPADVATLALRALDKDPQRRFASARELADELQRVRRRQPIATRAPGVVERLVRWSTRNRAAAAAFVVIALALVAALAAMARSRAAEARSRAAVSLLEAERARAVEPAAALGLVRTALEQLVAHGPDDAGVVLGRATELGQELTFALRERRLVERFPGTPTAVVAAPDGAHFVVLGAAFAAKVFTAVGEAVELSLPMGVAQAAWSADGAVLAVEERGSVLPYRRGSAGTWEELPALEVSEPVSSIAFDGAARILVVHGMQGEATLFDGGARTEIAAAQSPRFFAGAFLRDGGFVAAGALWERDGAARRFALDGHEEDDPVMQVVAHGDRFATRSQWRVCVWGVDAERIAKVDAAGRDGRQRFVGAAFSPDGTHLLVWSLGGSVRIHDRDGVQQAWHAPHAVQAAAFGGAGERVFVGDLVGDVEVLDRSLRPRRRFRVRGGGVRGLVPLGAGRLVVATSSGEVWLEDVGAAPGGRVRIGYDHPTLTWMADLDRLMVVSGDGRVCWFSAGGEEIATWETGPGLGGAARSPDRGALAVVQSPGAVWLGPVDGPLVRHEVAVPAPFGGLAGAPGWLEDGSFLLRTGRNHLLRWWADGSDASWIPLARRGRGRPCTALAVSPDGERTWVGDWWGTILPLEVGTGTTGAAVGRMDGAIVFLRVSRDGRYLLAGAMDTRLGVWDIGSGRCVAELAGHENTVVWADVAPDGRRVATASFDDTVRVWNLPGASRGARAGAPALVFSHPGVRQVLFLDDRRLVSAGSNGEVRWWWLDPEDVLRGLEGVEATGEYR